MLKSSEKVAIGATTARYYRDRLKTVVEPVRQATKLENGLIECLMGDGRTLTVCATRRIIVEGAP